MGKLLPMSLRTRILRAWQEAPSWNLSYLDSLTPHIQEPILREHDYGEVKCLEMGKKTFGASIITVRLYVVGDTMIDTGISCFSSEVIQFAKNKGVTKVLLTHHHEDHSGGAGHLKAAGFTVYTNALTARILSKGFNLRFYEHIMYSKPSKISKPLEIHPESGSISVGPYTAEILHVPGHCQDQYVYYIKEKGWIFSGDAFLGDKINIFRGDECFEGTLKAARWLANLPIKDIYCGHSPRVGGGDKAFQQKVSFLENLQRVTEEGSREGLSVEEITKRAFPRSKLPPFSTLLFWGDVSANNIIRSILYGPALRQEIDAIVTDRSK